jgi:hypothetical protein
MLMGMSDDGDGLGDGAAEAELADIMTSPDATTVELTRPLTTRDAFTDVPSAP